MNLTGQHGHAAGISVAVVLVVTGAICLGAFLLFRRHLKKKRPQLLMPESAEEIHTLDDLEDDIDTTKAGWNHIFPLLDVTKSDIHHSDIYVVVSVLPLDRFLASIFSTLSCFPPFSLIPHKTILSETHSA